VVASTFEYTARPASACVIVPPGATYSATGVVSSWVELR
jgi:hypothetical protein